MATAPNHAPTTMGDFEYPTNLHKDSAKFHWRSNGLTPSNTVLETVKNSCQPHSHQFSGKTDKPPRILRSILRKSHNDQSANHLIINNTQRNGMSAPHELIQTTQDLKIQTSIMEAQHHAARQAQSAANTAREAEIQQMERTDYNAQIAASDARFDAQIDMIIGQTSAHSTPSCSTLKELPTHIASSTTTPGILSSSVPSMIQVISPPDTKLTLKNLQQPPYTKPQKITTNTTSPAIVTMSPIGPSSTPPRTTPRTTTTTTSANNCCLQTVPKQPNDNQHKKITRDGDKMMAKPAQPITTMPTTTAQANIAPSISTPPPPTTTMITTTTSTKQYPLRPDHHHQLCSNSACPSGHPTPTTTTTTLTTKLKSIGLLMKPLRRALNNFLSFPTPPDRTPHSLLWLIYLF
jgi:hypothetical protein